MRITFEPAILQVPAFSPIAQNTAPEHPVFNPGLIERLNLGSRNLKGEITLSAYAAKDDAKKERVFIFASGKQGGFASFVYNAQTNDLQSGLAKAAEDVSENLRNYLTLQASLPIEKRELEDFKNNRESIIKARTEEKNRKHLLWNYHEEVTAQYEAELKNREREIKQAGESCKKLKAKVDNAFTLIDTGTPKP
jgi:hypothetical protein